MTNQKETRWWRAWHLFAAAALALTAGACGGDGPTETCPAGTTGSPPNCRPLEEPCTQDPLVQDSGPVTALTVVVDDFSVPDDGRLDITLDWTNAASVMGFYLVPVGTCTLEEFNERTCDFLIRGEPANQKPRRLTLDVNAGNYRWMVANYEEEQESVSLEIVLSQGGCASFASAGPAASARSRPPAKPIERIQPH